MITNQSWLTVAKINDDWPDFYTIVSYTNRADGMEMYFTKEIGDANGLTNPSGILIANTANACTIAHELGHAQNLLDVYEIAPDNSISVTGMVHRTRLSSDWGSSSTEGYYPVRLSQGNLVKRLLMWGYGPADKGDIPFGDIDAVWRNRSSQQYEASTSPTSFFLHASPYPANQ